MLYVFIIIFYVLIIMFCVYQNVVYVCHNVHHYVLCVDMFIIMFYVIMFYVLIIMFILLSSVDHNGPCL